jgi:hypothetical protein
MTTSNLYLVEDDGLLKVGTMFPLVAAPVIIGVALGLIIVSLTGLGTWVADSVILALVFAPIFAEYRARRLSNLNREDLASREGAKNIPWSSIEHMRIKGRTLTFRSNGLWTSATIETSDAARLGQKASSMLGGNFIAIPEEPPRFSPAARFFLLAGVIFIISEGITFAAALTPFFTGEQQHYANLYNSMEAGLGPTIFQQWGAIFLNNVEVALTGSVPGIGSLFLGFASYNTGRVAQIVAINNGYPPYLLLALLFILPHAWVEEVSYPLAGALGFYMFSWRRQSYAEFSNWHTRASTKVALGFASIALLLAIAATLEVSEPGLGLGALVLWVPVTAAAVYAYLKFRSRISAALS